ncbi:hypothetical protein H0H92_013798 [Tricholoma furcatifolium]|nr:hypothetical protein H0H92_013798 [Tricholoma furcatifolium]
MFFDTVHQVLISHTVYTYLVTNYDNPAQLSNLVWSMLVEVLFNGLTALLVQGFLTIRVWRLSNRNYWLTGLVVLLVAGEFGCIVAFGTLSLQFTTFRELARLKYLSISVNALAAAGDVLIALILCTLLHRSRTGFHRSDTMINKLEDDTRLRGWYTYHKREYIAFPPGASKKRHHDFKGALRLLISRWDPSNVDLTLPQRPTNISIKINTTKEFSSDRYSNRDHEGDLEKGGDSGLSIIGSTSCPSIVNVSVTEAQVD